MWSLLATTPSVTLNRVDVGGSTAGTQTTYFAYGYSGQNRPLIEGINTTEGTAAAGFYLDYGSFEEVFIGAAGNSAEMPNPGVLTQFVGKSGGNTPSGQPLLRLRERRHSRAAISTADQVIPGDRRARSVPTATASPATRTSTSASAGRSSRIKMWGHFAYLNQQNSVAAPPAGVDPRRHAVRHQAVQLHRQGHLSDEPGEQVHRLPAARHQAAAAPHRQQQSPRRAGPHHRRFDDAAGLAELGLQGRVERHARPEHVRGIPRRTVRLQLRPRQQHRSDALRGSSSPTRSAAAAATG